MGESKLRPEMSESVSDLKLVTNGTAYLMVLNAVETRDGLIEGRLHRNGEHCAVGSFFHVNPKCSMPWEIINEVAAVNDSMPNATPKQRKVRVARWLRWKLASLGMPGFERAVRRITRGPDSKRSTKRR